MKLKKDELLKFYNKFRIVIFPFVVALSCLILIVFVIFPQTQKLISNQNAKEALDSRAHFLEAKAATLESIDGVDLSRKLNIALSSYPAERDFGDIIGIIRSIANQNGFEVSGLVVSPVINQGISTGSEKYSVRVELTGSKNLLTRFIKALESQPRIMKLGTMEVTKSQQADVVTVLADVEVFYAPSPQSFGGADSELPSLSSADEQLLSTLASFTKASVTSSGSSVSTPRGKANPFE